MLKLVLVIMRLQVVSSCQDVGPRLDGTVVTVCRDPDTGEGRVAAVRDQLGNVNWRPWFVSATR